MDEIIEKDNIENLIYEVRGVQVMLSSDVAKLYQVETKVINQTIKRNINRFPKTFCFQLNDDEIEELSLRSQFVTLNKSNNFRGQHIKYFPYVLTEQGIMMLSGLLKSDIAVKVNIQIIEAFVKMRHYIGNNLIEQKYINSIVFEDHDRILKLEKSFDKLEENIKINDIYFNGQIFDAYSTIINIFKLAKKELIIIDEYADNTILDIVKRLDVNTTIITKKDNLLTNQDIEKYNKQYSNLKVKYDNTYHDRYFIIDKKIVYHCGTSINRIGYKTFSINLISDSDINELIIDRINTII